MINMWIIIKGPTWLAEPACSNRESRRAYAEYHTSDLNRTMLWNHAYSPLKKSTKYSMIIFLILMIIQWLWYKCVIYKMFARISLINSSISIRYAFEYRHFMWWYNKKRPHTEPHHKEANMSLKSSFLLITQHSIITFQVSYTWYNLWCFYLCLSVNWSAQKREIL